MSRESALKRRFAAINAMQTVKVTIGSTEYNTSRTVLSASKRNSLYGFDEAIAASYWFEVDDVDFDPTDADTLVDGSDTYRIVGHEYDANRVSLRLDTAFLYD